MTSAINEIIETLKNKIAAEPKTDLIKAAADYIRQAKDRLQSEGTTTAAACRQIKELWPQYLQDKANYMQLINETGAYKTATWNDFETSIINFNENKAFNSKLFGRRFPEGTISYIGARPGRGKTTMLINIAMDALQQDKQVVFITAEETTKQIIMRFCLRQAYDGKTKMEKPRTEFIKYIKDKANKKKTPYTDFFDIGTQKVKNLMLNNQLIITPTHGQSFAELNEYISLHDNALILIDYIQHLKTDDRYATASRQVQLQTISQTLANTAAANDLIMIAGAQFGRNVKTGGSEKPDASKADTFDETSYREAGDIEQDGHILIGIGKDPANKEYFYSCMKDREAAPDNGRLFLMETDFPFSFMQPLKNGQGEPLEYKNDKAAAANKNKKKSDINDIAEKFIKYNHDEKAI